MCNFSENLPGCHWAVIALDRALALIVSLGAIDYTGIADPYNQIAPIAGIANGAFHALVSDNASDY